jgi:hypothetical protein
MTPRRPREALDCLVYQVWQVPDPAGRRLLRALRQAACTRAQVVREQMALADVVDLEAAFAQHITPSFVMSVLEDLRATGWLTNRDVHTAEEAVLGCVDRHGRWLDYHAFQERNVS